jgi:hypothetical protein
VIVSAVPAVATVTFSVSRPAFALSLSAISPAEFAPLLVALTVPLPPRSSNTGASAVPTDTPLNVTAPVDVMRPRPPMMSPLVASNVADPAPVPISPLSVIELPAVTS